MKRVRILDTTLRDGEQTPGMSLTPEKKVVIAKKLDELGVDIIEAGSAIASAGERDAIKKIANLGLNADVASFCRILRGDIDAALSCDVDMICLVVSTSDLHIERKLRKTREQVVEMTIDSLNYAKEHGLKVEVLAEDGSRTDKEFLRDIFLKCEQNKADAVCVCDTVGVMTPERTEELYKFLLEKIKLPLAVHCHNDLGLAVANSLAAFRAGASEIHCTVNGYGERTGNAALEEVVVGLEYFYGVKTVKTKMLAEVSELLELLTGVKVAPNKPVVGKNAFAHESGIHVDGILKDACTYEPITPEMVGQKRRFVLGKHSGRKSIEMKLNEMGIKVSEEQLRWIVDKVKEVGDTGKEVTDADFTLIVFTALGIEDKPKVKLKELVTVTGTTITPTASVRLEIDGKTVVSAGTGNGPVDAAINAIENALGGTGVELIGYHVDAITGGTDALVDVKIQLRKDGREISAAGAGTDIVRASVEAMLRGLNLLLK
ncbi:MAG: 2-isopropylmalate synthase [Candidatus Micrarchaeia archaeon]